MAYRRLGSRLLAAALAASAIASAGPAAAQPRPGEGGDKAKPIVPPSKKTDMEIDPDAKPAPPPEEKPLPPTEPGQWGVGGKDDEGKFAPGGEKKEQEEAKKAKQQAEEKPVDLGPARSVSIDWVSGFGSVYDPTNAAGSNNGQTQVTSLSFIFAFSWRFAEIWTVGARFPFSQANLNGPMMMTDVAKTVAPGNLELYVRPSFQLTPRLRLPVQLSFFFPTAQGDLFGNTTTTNGFVPQEQALVNLAASAARGWEEMPLFSPHRFGIRAAVGINYDTENVHFAAGTGFDLMPRVGGDDPGMAGDGRQPPIEQIRGLSYAWVTKAQFFYSFAVGPGYIEPGLRAWLAYAKLPWYTTVGDDSGAQFVLEPAVSARYAVNEAKSLWVNGRLGFIAPVVGPLGSSPVVGASIKGFRVNAELQF